MNILVTGSSGQLGSALIQHFSDSKTYHVIGVDRVTLPGKEHGHLDNCHEGDLRDKNISIKFVNDADVIIHCAAQISVEKSIANPVEDASVNINCTLNLLDSIRHLENPKHFIYISSAAVYGKTHYLPIDEKHPTSPISPYGLSKLTAERYVQQYHDNYSIPTTIIRPFNLYGNNDISKKNNLNVIKKMLSNVLLENMVLIYDSGEQIRDFVHIQDVIQIIEKSMSNEMAIGEIFNCGSGKKTTINELVDTIEDIFRELELPHQINRTHSAPRSYEIKESYASILKGEKILGYRPKITLYEGLLDIIRSLSI